ncbi:MAG TPA: ATP-binding protein [Fimbriimonas sp.]
MLKRHAQRKVEEALSDTPVVLVHGPRQCGKSTLADLVFDGQRKVTLDDPISLALAKRDPEGFLEAYRPPIMIDEVQRAPELFLAIKRNVDRERQPGRFLLTGSANVLALPKMADSLAGRMEVVDLLPFSQGELEGSPDRFVEGVFAEHFGPSGFKPVAREEATMRILRGGFPEPSLRSSQSRRDAWFASYVRTLLDRDVKDLSSIEGLAQMPMLLNLVASRAGDVMNAASLATESGIPYTSLKRYLSLLESIFLVRFVNAWSSDRSKVFTKAPKAFLSDTGLLCHLGNVDQKALMTDDLRFLRALRNFVAMELLKGCTNSEERPWLLHLRTVRHLQVDFVLESRRGEVVGIEVRTTATLRPEDGDALRFLRELAGEKFRRGVVLYLGRETVALDRDIVGVPMSSLWA